MGVAERPGCLMAGGGGDGGGERLGGGKGMPPGRVGEGSSSKMCSGLGWWGLRRRCLVPGGRRAGTVTGQAWEVSAACE